MDNPRSAAAELRQQVADYIGTTHPLTAGHLDLTVDATLGITLTPAGPTVTATYVATANSPLLGQRIITAIIVPPNTTAGTVGDALIRQAQDEYDRTLGQANS